MDDDTQLALREVAARPAWGRRRALRGYCKTAAMAATGYLGDSPLFLADYLLRLLRVAVLLALWRTILAGRGAASGMALGSLLTYTLVAEAFAEPLACRTRVGEALWNGSITMHFLRPMGDFAQFAADACGRWAFGFGAFSLPLLLAAPLLGVNPLPASPLAGALFLVSLALAVAVGLALDFAFATLSVTLELNHWVAEQFRAALAAILTGALIPLALLPWGMGRVLEWLPTAAMASAPLRIYTGTGQPWGLLAAQAAWSAALWPLVVWLWRSNREKVVSYGG